MRTTVELDERLLKEVSSLVSFRTKKELLNLSLAELVKKKRRERLIASLGNRPLKTDLPLLEKTRRDE